MAFVPPYLDRDPETNYCASIGPGFNLFNDNCNKDNYFLCEVLPLHETAAPRDARETQTAQQIYVNGSLGSFSIYYEPK